MSASILEATCSAPVNLAVNKYWGKREPLHLILPTNSSLSVTLSQDDLRSTTTIRAVEGSHDRLWLNGKEEPLGARMEGCLREMRALRRKLESEGKENEAIADKPLHIVSVNNFPTAAGLASSASGFAALVFTLATLYKLPDDATALSKIARIGSGSACRSLFGGFVSWEMGVENDGKDSYAQLVAPQEHWPDMHALICVVSDAKKGTSSTAGMQRTVETSDFLQKRVQDQCPARMDVMKKAILAKDFDTFAEITMKDSNSFHATCLDTFPPIFYLNDTSRGIIALITELNRVSLAAGKGYYAAYTFDAGPNAVIFAPQANMPLVVSLINSYFPQTTEFNDSHGLLSAKSEPFADFNKNVIPTFAKGSVGRLIYTRVGDGPRVLDAKESLIGNDGLPKSH